MTADALFDTPTPGSPLSFALDPLPAKRATSAQPTTPNACTSRRRILQQPSACPLQSHLRIHRDVQESTSTSSTPIDCTKAMEVHNSSTTKPLESSLRDHPDPCPISADSPALVSWHQELKRESQTACFSRRRTNESPSICTLRSDHQVRATRRLRIKPYRNTAFGTPCRS